MMYSYNNVNFLDTTTDTELLEASVKLAKEYATRGWRLSMVQWATAEKAEYAHCFADPSPDGYDSWGDEPWDERLFSVVIVDDGERVYRWNWESQRFIRYDGDD